MKVRYSGIFSTLTAAGAAGVLGMIGGCSEPRGPLSVKSNDLTLKIPAIKQDVRRHNSSDDEQLVADLDDDDAAVRFYAIEGLSRLTGDDFGYHYYEDEDQRKPAMIRWQQWLRKR